jgi:hypothetical protein
MIPDKTSSKSLSKDAKNNRKTVETNAVLFGARICEFDSTNLLYVIQYGYVRHANASH